MGDWQPAHGLPEKGSTFDVTNPSWGPEGPAGLQEEATVARMGAEGMDSGRHYRGSLTPTPFSSLTAAPTLRWAGTN